MPNPLLRNGLFGLMFCLAFFHLFKTLPSYRLADQPYDARNVFIAGKLWLARENPYSDASLKAEWKKQIQTHKLSSTKPPGFPDCGMIYPFFSLPLLFPYYLFPWPLTRVVVWVLSWLCLLAIAGLAFLAFREFQLPFVFYLLLISSFKSGWVAVMLGQPLLLSLAALMFAWYLFVRGKESLAGIFLGIATIKFTLCIPFLLFFLTDRKWKLLLSAASVPAISTLAFYWVSGELPVDAMLGNMKHQLELNYAGPVLSAVNTNLTELGILGNYFGSLSSRLAISLNLLLSAIGILTFLLLYLKKFMGRYSLICLLILWSLLFSYHLIYDCMLLLFLIPIFRNISSKALQRFGFLLLSPLFIPINGLLKNYPPAQFHLPLVLFAVFLYVLYVCQQNYRSKQLV